MLYNNTVICSFILVYNTNMSIYELLKWCNFLLYCYSLLSKSRTNHQLNYVVTSFMLTLQTQWKHFGFLYDLKKLNYDKINIKHEWKERRIKYNKNLNSMKKNNLKESDTVTLNIYYKNKCLKKIQLHLQLWLFRWIFAK